jgi:hypothetical protein
VLAAPPTSLGTIYLPGLGKASSRSQLCWALWAPSSRYAADHPGLPENANNYFELCLRLPNPRPSPPLNPVSVHKSPTPNPRPSPSAQLHFAAAVMQVEWCCASLLLVNPQGSTTVSNLTFGDIDYIAAIKAGLDVSALLALQTAGRHALHLLVPICFQEGNSNKELGSAGFHLSVCTP